MCYPFPVQFGPLVENPQWWQRYGAGLGGEQDIASAKLKNHCKRLGFKEIGKTGFLILRANTFDPTDVLTTEVE